MLFRVPDKIYNPLKWAVGMLMGLFSVYGIGSLIPVSGLLGLIFVIFLFPAFFLFVTFVHEAGHALCGKRFKYQIQTFCVGPVAYRPSSKTFHLAAESHLNEIAGYVELLPPTRFNRWRDIWVSLCGPLATIILGILILAYGQTIDFYSEARIGTTALAWVCFLDAGFNLIPSKQAGRPGSDGYRILKNLTAKPRY